MSKRLGGAYVWVLLKTRAWLCTRYGHKWEPWGNDITYTSEGEPMAVTRYWKCTRCRLTKKTLCRVSVDGWWREPSRTGAVT